MYNIMSFVLVVSKLCLPLQAIIQSGQIDN